MSEDRFRRNEKDLLVKQGDRDNWGSIREKSIRRGNNRIYKSRDEWIFEKRKRFSDFKTAYRALKNTQSELLKDKSSRSKKLREKLR